MIMSIEKALSTAINLEKLGVSLYSELIKKFEHDPKLKNVFTILLNDEINHENEFTVLFEKYSKENLVLTEIQKEFLEANDLTRHFDQLENLDQDAEILDILRLVYYIERDAVLFFSGIKDVVGENKELNEIIKQEKKHMTSVLNCIIENEEFKGLDTL